MHQSVVSYSLAIIIYKYLAGRYVYINECYIHIIFENIHGTILNYCYYLNVRGAVV